MAENTFVDLDLQKLHIKRIKKKETITSYCTFQRLYDKQTNTSYNKRKSISLRNIYIPFGVEFYNNNSIINIELRRHTCNEHHNYYSEISAFESDMDNKDILNNICTKGDIQSDIIGKGYYPNIRDSKLGHIIRAHISTTPEVYEMVCGRDKKLKNIKDRRNVSDIKNIKANVTIELGTLWISDNNYGYMWILKSVEILQTY